MKEKESEEAVQKKIVDVEGKGTKLRTLGEVTVGVSVCACRDDPVFGIERGDGDLGQRAVWRDQSSQIYGSQSEEPKP